MDILMMLLFISSASGKPMDEACASYSFNGVSLLSLALHKNRPVGIFGYESVPETIMQKQDGAGHCRGFQMGSQSGIYY